MGKATGFCLVRASRNGKSLSLPPNPSVESNIISSNRKAAGCRNLRPQRNAWKTGKRCSRKFEPGRDDFHVVRIRFRSKNGTTWKSSLPPTTLRLAGADEEYQRPADCSYRRQNCESEGEGNAVVTHCTHRNGRNCTCPNADHVHNAIAGGAILRSHYLAEN